MEGSRHIPGLRVEHAERSACLIQTASIESSRALAFESLLSSVPSLLRSCSWAAASEVPSAHARPAPRSPMFASLLARNAQRFGSWNAGVAVCGLLTRRFTRRLRRYPTQRPCPPSVPTGIRLCTSRIRRQPPCGLEHSLTAPLGLTRRVDSLVPMLRIAPFL